MLTPYIAVSVGLVWLKSAWVAILLYHFLMVAAMALCMVRPVLRVGRVPLGIAVIGLGVSILSGLAIVVLHPWLGSTSWTTSLFEVRLSGARWQWFLPYFAIVHPPLEELYWRGYLQRSTAPLSIEDIAFAGYHALVLPFFLDPLWVAISVCCLTGASAIWRAMKLKYSGISLPLLTHVAADTSIILAVHFIVRTT